PSGVAGSALHATSRKAAIAETRIESILAWMCDARRMSGRLRVTIAVSALLVASCVALVAALYPRRSSYVILAGAHPLRMTRHTTAFGSHCFMEDELSGSLVSRPSTCGESPYTPDEGSDDVVAMLGNRSSTTVGFCVFDRRRGRDLRCYTGWFPAW